MLQDQKHVHVAGAGLAMKSYPNTTNHRSFPVDKSGRGGPAAPELAAGLSRF